MLTQSLLTQHNIQLTFRGWFSLLLFLKHLLLETSVKFTLIKIGASTKPMILLGILLATSPSQVISLKNPSSHVPLTSGFESLDGILTKLKS